MNFFIFLFIWALIWYAPIPPRKTGWKKPARIISLLLGLFLFFLIQFSNPPLSIFIYTLVFLRLFAAFVESAFSIKPVGLENSEKDYYYYRSKRVPWKVSAKMKAKIVGMLFLAYLLAFSSMVVFWQVQRVANAAYFNNFIHNMGLSLPFNK